MSDLDAPSPHLAELARAHGVATDYWDWQGRHVTVSAGTITSVLAALGVVVQTDEDVRAALEDTADHAWRQVVPPTTVVREGEGAHIHVHVEDGSAVTLDIVLETGERRTAQQVDRWVPPRLVDGYPVGEATFALPDDLPLGWHALEATVANVDTVQGVLVVTPRRLDLPAALEGDRAWGVLTQLYQVRSAQSWGVGDLADLATLAAWGGGLGADFVLVNPLHAAEPSGHMEPSPYLPTTRQFTNPLYICVPQIPEYAELAPVDRGVVDALAVQAQTLNGHDHIDRDTAWLRKREALEIVAAVPLSAERQAAFAAYRLEHGASLENFALWCALTDEYGPSWRTWPAAYQTPGTADLAAYADEHADAVRFHTWLQWIVDEQVHVAQEAALGAGMRIGVVKDLAVGVHPEGADAWGLAAALAQGVTVGAPPDQFNQLGQNWHQPPWHPGRLADLGYGPFRDMVRAALQDAGGLRVDHVIGLFRLWWVPRGANADAGTYVRYDHEALVGILALEAHRAGAIVVGEDLGVVEPMARDYLRERGILGTSILWFEWADGRPLPPEAYRELCLASVTTHDLPPTAGYLDLVHVALRERLGLLTRSAEEETAVERGSVDAVTSMLVERGFLAADQRGDIHATVAALHAAITATPARLLGVGLADLVGDRRIINQPGTQDEYPNWRVPLGGPDERPLSLEEAMVSPLVADVVRRLPHRS